MKRDFSCRQSRWDRRPNERGFSMIELMLVVTVITIVLGITIPTVAAITRNFRITSDTRSISAQLNLARMRAAAGETHARVYMDLSGNSLHLEIWNKTSTCWQTDGDSNNCTQTSSPVIPLAPGGSFGFGSIANGPTGTAAAQAPACTAGVAGPAPGSTTANTACVEFNSRSYPVDSTGAIVASDTVYLGNNGKAYSAVAVSIAGQPTAYAYSGGAWIAF